MVYMYLLQQCISELMLTITKRCVYSAGTGIQNFHLKLPVPAL